MKTVLDFIKNNELDKNEMYNHVNDLFCVENTQTGRIRSYVKISDSFIYYVIDGFLYRENGRTGKVIKRKI